MNNGGAKKVAFLDRDGTINVDHGYVFEIERWEWCEGAIEGMKILADAGYALAVVTNQSAIADGRYTAADMAKLHDFMKAELHRHGVTIAAIGFCPHGRDTKDCPCRKPKAGMAKQVEDVIGEIDYGSSWTIGDKEADVGFGKNAGTKTALVKSRYWTLEELKLEPDVIVDSLLEAAKKITSI
ncbi:MAG: HAD family hydrolase [Candidatus Andersenbacteria bacterium]|nr:HAD family hydrolase [Candidatus Andersenbacteria bacterium]